MIRDIPGVVYSKSEWTSLAEAVRSIVFVHKYVQVAKRFARFYSKICATSVVETALVGATILTGSLNLL